MGSYQRSDSRDKNQELSRYLLELIVVRAIVLLLGLNLADRLGILQERFGSFPFLPLFNILALMLTLTFLILWMWVRNKLFQLYIQTGADLILVTILVAYTGGIESAFVSFYLLIIIYCSLTLGRNGGMVGSALSTILYAGIIATNHLGIYWLQQWRRQYVPGHVSHIRSRARILGRGVPGYIPAQAPSNHRRRTQRKNRFTDPAAAAQRTYCEQHPEWIDYH